MLEEKDALMAGLRIGLQRENGPKVVLNEALYILLAAGTVYNYVK